MNALVRGSEFVVLSGRRTVLFVLIKNWIVSISKKTRTQNLKLPTKKTNGRAGFRYSLTTYQLTT